MVANIGQEAKQRLIAKVANLLNNIIKEETKE